MDKQTKLSEEQINSIKKEIENVDINGKTDTDEFIKKHLNEEQANKVRDILNNPEKLKSVLSSPMAQRFLESLKGKDKKEE